MCDYKLEKIPIVVLERLKLIPINETEWEYDLNNSLLKPLYFEDIYSCDICGHVFSPKSGYTKHLNHHEHLKATKCYVCGKICSTPQALSVHKKTHWEYNNFECLICNKTFKEKSYLANHKKSKQHIVNEKWHEDKEVSKLNSAKRAKVVETLSSSTEEIVEEKGTVVPSPINLDKAKGSAVGMNHVASTGKCSLNVTYLTPSKTAECDSLLTKRKQRPRVKQNATKIGQDDVKCDICSAVFFDKKNLKRHIATKYHIRNEMIIKGQVTLTSAFRNVAYLTPSKTAEFDSLLTKRKQRQKVKLNATQIDRDDVKCDICNVTFFDKRNLRRHIAMKYHIRNEMIIKSHVAACSSANLGKLNGNQPFVKHVQH